MYTACKRRLYTLMYTPVYTGRVRCTLYTDCARPSTGLVHVNTTVYTDGVHGRVHGNVERPCRGRVYGTGPHGREHGRTPVYTDGRYTAACTGRVH